MTEDTTASTKFYAINGESKETNPCHLPFTPIYIGPHAAWTEDGTRAVFLALRGTENPLGQGGTEYVKKQPKKRRLNKDPRSKRAVTTGTEVTFHFISQFNCSGHSLTCSLSVLFFDGGGAGMPHTRKHLVIFLPLFNH